MTLEDLATFPVWEFGLDEESIEGRDETWVRPVATEVVRVGTWEQLVAAEFSSRAWMDSLSGFMIITTAKSDHRDLKEVPDPDWAGSGCSSSGGSILSTTGGYHHIPVYPTIEPFRSQRAPRVMQDRAIFAAWLGCEVGDIFPIRYRLLVLIEGELSFREGTIH